MPVGLRKYDARKFFKLALKLDGSCYCDLVVDRVDNITAKKHAVYNVTLVDHSGGTFFKGTADEIVEEVSEYASV